MPNFTTEDLLAYMYNELESKQSTQLEQALQTDWALQQKLQVLTEAQQKLNEMPLLSPRAATVDNILRYAELHSHVSN